MDVLQTSVDVEDPETGGIISLPAGTEIGEIITSPESGAELEVVSIDPPRLDFAPQEEEDWGE